AAASSAPAGQGRICGSNAILLVENPVTSNYFWYTDLNGDPIGVGIGLNTTNIPANNTYFVTTGARSSAGLPTKAAFPNGGGYLSNTNHFMKYTSSTPLYLETVKLYSKFGGKVELIVADITSETGTTFTYNTLSSTVIDVVTSSPNPGPGDQPGYDAADTGAIFHVNLFLPSGSHALIVKTQGSTNLFRNNNLTGNPYPMSKPGLISFTSNNAVSEGGTSQDYYYFLYDMRIRTSECMSNQGTIVATVAPTPSISQSGSSLVSSISTGNQWYLNGNAIAGAAGSTFNPTQGGAYTVTVTDNFGCQRTSAAFSWWPTSTGVVNDPEFNLNVFPNPNPGAFVVRFKASKRENVTLELLNVQGQTVQVKSFQNVLGDFSEQMEMKNAAAGVYMLRIQYGASVFFRKIVIE
ncbi:MAG TPA: T9SS type A sorting domain-containing protein, partial [Flavisolibacter sp.]